MDRQRVIQALHRFRSSWLELGQLLVEVRDSSAYKAWGFASFEAYCAKELRLRKPTVSKLTRSYRFLSRHEPKALREADVGEKAPAFEVVQVLADAEERGQLSTEEYREIRDKIWSPERPAAVLRRELNSRFPPSAPRAIDEGAHLLRLAATARRVAEELQGIRRVPRGLVEQAKGLAQAIETLSEAAAA
ncbi:MAG: hypothetical protein ACKVPX_08695 [Myxococcaceae bacterium]